MTSDLQLLYYKKPVDDDTEFTVEQDAFEKTFELETLKTNGGNSSWYKIKTSKTEKAQNNTNKYLEIEG